jgi:hypothetical protein
MIVAVVSYFDEEQMQPAEYVRAKSDGFEAIGVEYAGPDVGGEASLGIYPTIDLALDAITRFQNHQREISHKQVMIDCLQWWHPPQSSKPH